MDEASDRALLQAGEDRRLHQRLTANLDRARQGLATAERELREAGEIVAAEAEDVAALEGLSLTGLFVSIFGDKDKRLERERKELAAAKLRYDERLDASESLSGDVASLEQRLAQLGDAEARYIEVLAAREQALMTAPGPRAAELTSVVEQLADARADVGELDEAATAANAALAALRDTADELGGARSWGTFDMMGGGVFATLAKHGRIDKARAAAHRAQRSLRTLERELTDVGGRARLDVDVGGMLSFADWFLDGLLVDWIVQSRIVHALERVEQTRDKVGAVMEQLRGGVRRARQRVDELEQQRRALLEAT